MSRGYIHLSGFKDAVFEGNFSVGLSHQAATIVYPFLFGHLSVEKAIFQSQVRIRAERLGHYTAIVSVLIISGAGGIYMHTYPAIADNDLFAGPRHQAGYIPLVRLCYPLDTQVFDNGTVSHIAERSKILQNSSAALLAGITCKSEGVAIPVKNTSEGMSGRPAYHVIVIIIINYRNIGHKPEVFARKVVIDATFIHLLPVCRRFDEIGVLRSSLAVIRKSTL